MSLSRSLLPRIERPSRRASRKHANEVSPTRAATSSDLDFLNFSLPHFLQFRGLIEGLHRIVCDEIFVHHRSRVLEGNCLCNLHKKTGEFYLQEGGKTQVRRNLFSLARRSRSILEIGFNAGHSAVLFCYAWAVDASINKNRENRRYLAFDLCEHSYTQPCFEFLRQNMTDDAPSSDSDHCNIPPCHLTLVQGDSRETLISYQPESESNSSLSSDSDASELFDLLHIDGGHSAAICRADILNARRFARRIGESTPIMCASSTASLLLVDDAHMMGVGEVLAELSAAGVIREVDIDEADLENRSPGSNFTKNIIDFEKCKMQKLFWYV